MLSDLQLSLRALAKSPMFATVAILTLMLGIGVNTAMFSIVNAAVLRGLPFDEQERLMHVENNNLVDNINSMGMSHADFVDIRSKQTSFEDLGIYQERTLNISSEGQDPERITGCALSHSLPSMLRVPVHSGRWFHADEDKPGAAAVIVLGYSLWENRFKSDPAIVGKQIKVNGEWATVVGVGPKGYRFPEESDAWVTPRFKAFDEKRDNRYWEVAGRLKDGVTPEAARAELQGIGSQLAAAFPATNRNVGVSVKTLQEEFIGDDTRQLLFVMLGAVFLVMLIACANVANLLLSRAAVRQKEIAIRTALGSGRGRIVRLLLTESLVLALAGAALGLGVAYGLMEIFNHYIQRQAPPYWMVFKIDHVSIAYICALAVTASILAGLWPAFRASRSDLTLALKDGGRGSTTFSLSRFSKLMVIGEVVLSCVLLVLSGLYVRSVIEIQSAPLGFSTDRIFTNRIGLPEAEYKTAAQQADFYTRLLETLAARADVESVAISNVQPTWNNRSSIQIEGRKVAPDSPRIFGSQAYVSGSYFHTLGVKLLQGRTFDQRDSATAPKVAIVSTRFAEKYWPGENPLGRKFTYESGTSVKTEDWITVVGVVTPTLQGEFDREDGQTPQAYLPYTQQTTLRFMTVFTKARAGDGAALATTVRAAVRSLDDDLPIYWPQTFEAMVEDAKFFKKLFVWIFGIFGGVALLLSGIGLYGVMAYSVSQRTQEIGVRMALGASPGDVMRLILQEGGVRLAIGLVVGLVLGYFAAGLQKNFLYNIQPADAPTFIATFLTLAIAGVAACTIPAMRALKINPVEALRGD